VVPRVDLPLVARMLAGDQIRLASLDSSEAAGLDTHERSFRLPVHDLGQAQHLG
jgi:hypothetical protein